MARPSLKPAVLAAGLLLLVGPIVAALFVRNRPESSPPPPPAPTAAARPAPRPGFPVPPKGGVLFARQWGGRALALGVVPQRGHVLAQASVLGGQGLGVSGLAVTLNGRPAAPCGSGCYAATLPGSPRSIVVHARSTSWRVELPAEWPPRDGTAVVDRATAAWRALRSLSFNEHLASDAIHETTSAWRIEAPDKVAYQIVDGGGSGIIVGDRRWDRTTTKGKWVESAQTELVQPLPPWTGVRDAHVLAADTVRGRPVWRVSFFDPGTPAWFTVAIDRRNYRTLESMMITTAHFMHDVYGSFNATPAIKPPS